jgi:hypothetical protein
MSTDELLAEAQRLTAWATELERRSREVAGGGVQTIGWETARIEILKELER